MTGLQRSSPNSWASYYIYAVLITWALSPGIRRLIDWRSSFSSISIISVLPLVSLLPAAVILITSRSSKNLDRRLVYASWLWFGGFAYAYAVSLAAGNAVSGTYTLMEFALPSAFALWVATIDVEATVLYERLSTTLLILAALLSAYAFVQFTLAPPWDIAWMERTKLLSIGTPAAFSFRPFSMLNAPGPFADFLTAAVLLNLPKMRHFNILRLAAFVVCLGALTLTLARSNWLALLVGALAYVILSPGRARNLTVLGFFALTITLLIANASSLLGNSRAGIDLQNRFDTLANLSNDRSYIVRKQYLGNALSDAIESPTGEGLGVLGTAAKLGSSGETVDFDNGYIARFTEMGYFGTACYLITLGFALYIALRRWNVYRSAGFRDASSVAAACLAIQLAFLFLDISSDHHSELGGLFFWLSIAIVYCYRSPDLARKQFGEKSAVLSA
jgi:hypothetical protein